MKKSHQWRLAPWSLKLKAPRALYPTTQPAQNIEKKLKPRLKKIFVTSKEQ